MPDGSDLRDRMPSIAACMTDPMFLRVGRGIAWTREIGTHHLISFRKIKKTAKTIAARKKTQYNIL